MYSPGPHYLRSFLEANSSESLFISSFSPHFLFIFSFSLHFLAARMTGCHNLCNPGTPLPVCRQQTLPSQKRCWTHTAANREVVSSVLQHAAAMIVSFDDTWSFGCIMNPSLHNVFSEPMYSHLCWQIRQVWTRGVQCAPAATLRLKVASGWSTSLCLCTSLYL